MSLTIFRYHLSCYKIALLLCLTVSMATFSLAQQPADAERTQALKMLWEESRPEDALPLLEKLAKSRPDDGIVMFSYGFALLGHAKLLKDADARKQTRIDARNSMIKAQDLGVKEPLLKSVLEGLSADGGKDDVFSDNKIADDAMRDGEIAYVHGDFRSAAAAYQRALEADPKLYEAALFAGDMSFKLDLNNKAAEWYARAVQINPDRETAYRYSATPFLKQGKLEEARQRYIEAVIAEPYNRLTWSGLGQWADAAGVTLAHPRVEIPTSVTPLKDGNMTIKLDPKLTDDKDGSGLGSWIFYGIHRSAWAMSKFAEVYPKEKTYRHSLREEFEALSGVVEAVKQRQKDKKIKELDASLTNLVKLSDEGLLEPFILFALADAGISRDYDGYRKENRDKLRRYLVQYVTAGK